MGAAARAARQPAYLVLYQACEREVVKNVCEVAPYLGVPVLAQALIVEPIPATTPGLRTAPARRAAAKDVKGSPGGHSHLCNLTALVVAPEDGDAVPVPDLERHQQRDCLYAVVAPVHVVAHEQVVGVWAVPAYPEEL